MLRVGNHADIQTADILVLGVILHQSKILSLGAFWKSVDTDDIQVVIQVPPPIPRSVRGVVLTGLNKKLYKLSFMPLHLYHLTMFTLL